MTGHAEKPAAPLAFDEGLAQAVRRAVEATLQDTFQINTRQETWSVSKRLPPVLESHVICLIDIKQKNVPCGTFMLLLDREIVQKVLAQYGAEDAGDPRIVDDAAQELTNMIYGSFKTAMNKAGYHLVMDLPFSPAENEISGKYAQVEKMLMPFLADGHRCQVVVAQSA